MENTYENICLPWPEWRIVRYLGGGAYGKVYEIERNISGIKEKAALKIISRPKDYAEIEACYDNGYDKASIMTSYESEIQNYVKEYKLMRELQGQSNIVSCDDFTVVPHENGIGGDIFIRMELLTSLQQVLRERTLSEEKIIKLGKDISRALILCESQNIIHRDIKPANIMISKFGDYKLGDFGVSKVMDHTTFATAMGTPEYQAPEVVHMEKYGQTADIYSLGVTLYWLLNNRKMPFIGADERLTPMAQSEASMKRYRGDKLPAPKNGSAKFKQIVLKACEYRPENRYASAREMYEVLDALGTETASESNGRQENRNLTKGEDLYKTFSAAENETETIAGAVVSRDNEKTWNSAQDEGNSWGESFGTIGNPGQMVRKAEANKAEDFSSSTIGIKNTAKRKNEARKSNENTVSLDEILAKVSVEKITVKDIIEEIGISIFHIGCGAFLILIGILLITNPFSRKLLDNSSFISSVVGLLLESITAVLGFICLAIFYKGLPKFGKRAFTGWMKQNQTKIPNIDDLIKTNSDFAKRLYYQKCPKKYLLDYMQKLNPVVVKEIKASKK